MAEVTIKLRLDGPYKVSGPARVTDSGGSVVHPGEPDAVVALCRCGRSRHAPDCDGSHRTPGE
jgi:CDGSH-type Zn-finger protein